MISPVGRLKPTEARSATARCFPPGVSRPVGHDAVADGLVLVMPTEGSRSLVVRGLEPSP